MLHPHQSSRNPANPSGFANEPPQATTSGRRHQKFPFVALWVAFLAVIAPALGGGHQPWSWGILGLLVGITLLARTLLFQKDSAKKSEPGSLLLWLLVASILAVSFLPHSLFPAPQWRTLLVQEFQFPFFPTLSPQPWLTIQALGIFFVGLAWWLLLHPAAEGETQRAFLCHAFVVLLALLGGWILVCAFAQVAPPFWHSEWKFGPFPNRNQMGNLAGLAAFLALVGFVRDGTNRNARSFLWVALLALFLAILVFNRSRGGLLVLVVATIIWAILLSRRFRSIGQLATIAGLLLIGAAGFLFYGGPLLNRILTQDHDLTLQGSLGFRLLVFQDTLRLLADNWITGVGLGNFEQIFPLYREASLNPYRIIHPESDFLWLASELGLPLSLFFLILFLRGYRDLLPARHVRNYEYRAAGFAIGIAFLLHGLIDVSGHRLGSVLPALLAIALASDLRSGCVPGFGAVSRSQHLFVGGIAAIFGLSLLLLPNKPGFIAWQRHLDDVQSALDRGEWTEASESIKQGLVSAPLDWIFYTQRAKVRALSGEPWSEVARDFQLARTLEPSSPDVPLNEAQFYASYGRLAESASAWRLATERDPALLSARSIDLLQSGLAETNAFRAAFIAAAGRERTKQLRFLELANPAEFAALLDQWLQQDPALQNWSAAERRQLFEHWIRHGDPEQLLRLSAIYPHWLQQSWTLLFSYLGEQGDFARAVRLALPLAPKPLLPPPDPSLEVDILEKRVISVPNDWMASYQLYLIYTSHGTRQEDVWNLVRRVTDQPEPPHYWSYLEATTASQLGKWEEAWTALRSYLRFQELMP